MIIDKPVIYAHVFVSNDVVEFASARTRDPGDVIDQARAHVAEAIALRNAEIVKHYTPTAEDLRCLQMALRHKVV